MHQWSSDGCIAGINMYTLNAQRKLKIWLLFARVAGSNAVRKSRFKNVGVSQNHICTLFWRQKIYMYIFLFPLSDSSYQTDQKKGTPKQCEKTNSCGISNQDGKTSIRSLKIKVILMTLLSLMLKMFG